MVGLIIKVGRKRHLLKAALPVLDRQAGFHRMLAES